MDIQSSSQGTGSDDNEIAKVLAGVNEQMEKGQADSPTGLHFEETGSASVAPTAPDPVLPPPPVPAPDPAPVPAIPASDSAPKAAPTNPALDGIKKDALNELRPLVDKLNVSPEEKFDTYLLLIRSTDDQSLIGPAHDAAKEIADEARRAQALLDIIKEIDYLSNHAS